mmetsp:Transcript_16156/g.46392  ORF Transcript_16156/g.46392 Transcript_16156/m.46392 type:complete len:282 (+) Transcript_16156:430-1275(+)
MRLSIANSGIANGPDAALVSLYAQVLIGNDPAVRSAGQNSLDSFGEFNRGQPGGPDQRTKRQDAAIAQQGPLGLEAKSISVVLFHASYRTTQPNVNVALLEQLPSVVLQVGLERREQCRSGLDQRHLDVGEQVAEHLLHVVGNKVVQLRHEFARRRSAPDDDEAEQPPAFLLARSRDGRLLERVHNVVANVPGVVQVLQEVDAIPLPNAVDAKRVGLDADGDDEPVVPDGELFVVEGALAQDGLGLGIDRAGLGLDVVAVGAQGLADGFLDAAEFQGTDGR